MRTSIEGKYEMEQISPNTWQEHLLQRILIIAAIIGFFALIPAVIGTSDLFLQSVYIGVFVLLVAVIVIRLPYLVKATVFVLLPFALGLGNFTETGIRGDSLFFFLAFVTFSSLLIGPRAGFIALFIAESITIGMGYLILTNQFALSDKFSAKGDLAEWITAAISQLLISLVIITTLRMLNETYQKIRSQAVEAHQAQLVSANEIESRITERTQELTRRMELLNAASIVTHQTAILQDLDNLLNQVATLISERFGCYHVGIYLINQRGDYVTLQAASSEGGNRLLEQGFRLRVGAEGIIGFVAAEKKPRIAQDVNKDNIFFDNKELTETRSEISMPLVAHNTLIGVLDLQSSEVNAFRYADLEIFQGMADQIAVAIENARLHIESRLLISQLEIISKENTRQNWKVERASHKSGYRYAATGVHPIGKSNAKNRVERNVLEIPIVLREQKIGAIAIKRKDDQQKWTSKEESVAKEVAAQTALALENIRLVERTRERASREQTISNISARIRETLDLDIVLRTSAREIQKALNLQEAEVRLIPIDHRGDDDSPINSVY